MAQHALLRISDLAEGRVLAPERYDPRCRTTLATTVGDVADHMHDLVSPDGPEELGACLVIDTSDARDGVLRGGKGRVARSAIGSTKKRTQPGDVLISRLRPYLRQVAYVDHGAAEGVVLLCSTEFFVLRARDQRSIAFLVPLLLSEPVQMRLALSQEGGHHPRFRESSLLSVAVPAGIDRDGVSAAVVSAVERVRAADTELRGLTERLSRAE